MKTVGILFSNLHDNNLAELTAKRTLASVPYAGRYRLVDFTLSNMVNSGINTVGIVTKSNYQSLMDHVGSGKHWDLSRKIGGLIILPPYSATATQGIYTNRFEALRNALNFLRRTNEDYVIMTDCDIVCNFDYSNVVKFHVDNHADITVVTMGMSEKGCSDKVVIEADEQGRVRKVSVCEKPQMHQRYYANMTVISRKFLLSLLDDQANKSFHKDILINGVSKYRIFAYQTEGYFAVIDSLHGYYAHSMELLDRQVRLGLFNNNGAEIYTKVRDSAPARFVRGSVVDNSLVADGCVIEGEVHNSILFRGVKVSRGCKITDSIIMQDAVIGEGTHLHCVIADKNSVILDKRMLSGHPTHPYFISKGSVI